MIKNIIIIFICVIIAFVAFVAFFFRKPKNIIRLFNEDDVYSPAYGKIMDVIYNNDNTITIPIFLSILDIHYQNFPISGTLIDVQYDNTGIFEIAYKMNKSNMNEKVIHTIVNKNGTFKVYQIAGLIARRINYYNKPICNIENGDKLGIIYFGSRVDIIIPNADKFNLFVNKNDYMSGTHTLLGTFRNF